MSVARSSQAVPERASRTDEFPLRRILVPLDGFPASEAILPVAEALAHESASTIRLIRAVSPAAEQSPGVQAGGEAAAYLGRIGEQVRERGLTRIFWSVWHAEPEQAIVHAAAQNRADVIAITAHGRRGGDRLPLGRIATHLVHHAPTPVLLLIAGRAPARAEGTSILVVLDGSPESMGMLAVVRRLGRRTDRPVLLLQVVTPGTAAAVPVSALGRAAASREIQAQASLAEIADDLRAGGVRVRYAVRVAPAAEAVLDAAWQERAGLIAMAAPPSLDPGADPFGPVVARVLALARIPMLLWWSRPP